MAMVMYLFTCGFVCDSSNAYSTCNVHTDSKCITYNNAYTSKHDIGINVHDSHCFASSSAFINHSFNPAKRLLCGGTQSNTAKRLYTGTQYVVVVKVTVAKCCPKHIYEGIQLCKGSQDALDAVIPLGLALAWYEGYTPIGMKGSAKLLQKNCAG